MKDDDQLLSVLYLLLADELADIKEDVAHSRMHQNRDAGILNVTTRKQATGAMQNAGWLIERIIFFEGSLKASKLDDQETANMLKRIHRMQAGHVDWFGMNLFN